MQIRSIHISFSFLRVMLLSCAFVLLSCTKQEHGDGHAIGFSSPQLKSVINAPSDIERFSVWGRYNDTEDILVGEVVYRNAYNAFVYDDTQYWREGRVYDFYAVHPARTTYNAYTAAAVDDAGNISVEGFDVSTQNDLMIARSEGLTFVDDGTAPEPVSFRFSHLLTNVGFSFVKDPANDEEIEIKNIQLTGVRQKGSYDRLGWTLDPATFTLTTEELTEDNALSKDESQRLVISTLMLPQTVNGSSVSLTVNFVVTRNVGGYLEATPMTRTTVMPAGTWGIAEKITYKAAIGVNYNITFSKPIVESWSPQQSGGTIIIK